MARFIKSFSNDAAIQAAVDNKTLGKPYVALDKATGTIDWNGKDIDYSKMYLTIEALSGGTFYVRNANVGYSVNGGEWETTTGETALSLNQGDAVRFKGTSVTAENLFSGNTLSFSAYGNVESLEYGDDFIGKTTVKNNNAFKWLFRRCRNMVITKKLILPARSLKQECYNAMFNECISLEKAPELPATTLADYCYSSMFHDCTSLTDAPELPATTLTKYCYNQMFRNCSKLDNIKCLATNTSALGCITDWLRNVSPTGTFVKKAGATWPTGASGIPSGWTVIEE